MTHDVRILKQKGYNFLWIDDGLWMWDIPSEERAQEELAKETHGKVLVAGYGLGIVQEYIMDNPRVSRLLTVELIQEVLDANIKTFGHVFGECIVGDFYDMDEGEKYDYVVGDIWVDIVEESLEEYIKFKEKAVKLLKPGGSILAWGQEFFEYLIESGRGR